MKTVLLFLFLTASCTCFANRIYVNPLATDTANGTSWSKAYKNLQDGLGLAQTGDTVLVAAGIYKNPGGNSLYYYRIRNGGITVLGGYPNTGNPTDVQRNWVNHPTILSGEGGVNGYADNVLLIENLVNPVVFDGFIMRNADPIGLRINNSQAIVIKNTVFENNRSWLIHINNSAVSFINCVFFNNPTTLMKNNTNANTSFYNCVIANNQGYSDIIKNENASLAMYNCTLANNSGIPITSTGTGTTVIKNSIFWGNRLANRSENVDINSTNHSIQVSHCITQTYYSDSVNTVLVNHHPRFMNQLQPAGADNKFFTADDGLQLTVPCSPALNYGDNSLLGSITNDILGNPRLFNGGIVDLGAYEMQQAPGSHLKTVYVNNSAGNTGTHDGSSWAHAFTTLQDALLYCADTIKIAAGTYLTSNSEKDSVFSLESGKVILGGYPATGNPTDADRNPGLHHTILKGNYSSGATAGLPVIKSYHNDSTTILDGIKVTNWATSGGLNSMAVAIDYKSKLKILNCDFRLDAALGIRVTGLYIRGASAPTIYKCEFNTGSTEGDGIAVSCSQNSDPVFSWCNFRGYLGYQNKTTAIAVNNSSLTLDSCFFWQNSTDAKVTFVSSNTSVLAITNCVFRAHGNYQSLIYNGSNTTGVVNNSLFRNVSADGDVPAVYNDNGHLIFNKCLFDSTRLVMRNINRSSPVLNNCVSIHGRFMFNKRSTPVVNNCTVVNTYLQALDARAREELVINEDSSVFRANNTIFWSAKLNPGKKDILDLQYLGITTSILTNCLTQNYGTHGQNGNIVGKVPRFYRLDQILGPDGQLFTADDGLQLATCSPAVNTGNGSLGTILATDVLNNPRISQAVVDMGAYELQQPGSSSGTYYVNSTASGNNAGTSWNDAYPDLQTALCNACTDTIRVAAGEYKPAVSKRDSSFVINQPLALYGGYPATGNPTESDRDPVKHPTILSANIGSPTDSLDNSGLIVFVNAVIDSVHIDGFVMRDAYNSGGLAVNAVGGAGLCVLYSNTGIYNCRFVNNRASPYGGGVSISSNSRCTVNRCIFTGNSTTNAGGALYSKGYLRLTGSVFENNYCDLKGGAVCAAAGFDISNSVFYRNYTTSTHRDAVGGGLHAAEGGGNIYNCSFVENKATYPFDRVGGGLYTDEVLNVQIKNCIFSGNMAGSSTNTRGADLDWSGNYGTVHNCLLQYERPYPLPAMRNIITEAGFESVNDPKGADSTWLTEDDGLQLHYASAAINHGQDQAVTKLPVDILGDARIALDTVDAGAYEYQNRPVARAGADTIICTGTSVKVGRDGNPAHIYNWTSDPAGFTSTSAAPVVSPSVPTVYFLEVSNGTQVARDTIQISMSDSLPPTVHVVTASSPVCAGAPAIITAIPMYGGADPSYQWMVNGVHVGTDTAILSTTLQQGDKVHVVLTSNASCASPVTATSNVITMSVTPVVIPDVTVNGPVSFCAGDTVTYTATPVNAGPKPIYTWWKGGLFQATTYDNTFITSSITSQVEVYVTMVTNAVCQTKPVDTSNRLLVVPKFTTTPSVSISASDASICGVQLVTFTAQGFGPGTSPLWQWKVNGNNVGTNSNVYKSNTLGNGDNVYVVMTSNAECPKPPVVESNRVTMTVETVTVPTVSITAPTEVPQDTIVAVNASLVNGHGTATYQWQDSTATHNWQTIPGAITQTVNYTPRKTGDKIRCLAQTTTNCGDPVTVQSEPVSFKVNMVTGINPVPAGNYGITSWPNPVNTYMVIDGLRLSDQWQMLEIASIEGRQKILVQPIAGQTQVTLNTVQLKTGLYIVILRKKNGEMVYVKFVKL